MTPEQEAAIQARSLRSCVWDEGAVPDDVARFLWDAVHDRALLLAALKEARDGSYWQIAATATQRTVERDRLAEALRRALAELGGRHSLHWDPTMQSGRGCPVCIRERDVKAELGAVLAEAEPLE